MSSVAGVSMKNPFFDPVYSSFNITALGTGSTLPSATRNGNLSNTIFIMIYDLLV